MHIYIYICIYIYVYIYIIYIHIYMHIYIYIYIYKDRVTSLTRWRSRGRPRGKRGHRGSRPRSGRDFSISRRYPSSRMASPASGTRSTVECISSGTCYLCVLFIVIIVIIHVIRVTHVIHANRQLCYSC